MFLVATVLILVITMDSFQIKIALYSIAFFNIQVNNSKVVIILQGIKIFLINVNKQAVYFVNNM